ncbi:GNAT family N-acetyltransferase [Metabacillus schmidteae]|uniref:GNAT family N-acetyltransferase n=1 Tax=Metabacillus schmidteae TaxID=2730405 RepID=UPI00158B2A7E|nr:GNAT family N-acetyltransferase [Metabacillus schmidteae]
MDIHELNKHDLPAYLELLRELDQDQVLSLEAGEELLTNIAGYPFYKVYLVKNDQDQILGTFSLLICDNFGHGGRKFAIVENVVVHPTHKQKGIGKNMMELARTISAEEGCYKIMLSSNQARTDAHAFYDSLGFTRHGISFRTELR